MIMAFCSRRLITYLYFCTLLNFSQKLFQYGAISGLSIGLGQGDPTQPNPWVGLGLSFRPNLNFCFFEAVFWRKISFYWAKIVVCHPNKSYFLFKIPISVTRRDLFFKKIDNMRPYTNILGKITQVGSGWVKIREKSAQVGSVGSSWVKSG